MTLLLDYADPSTRPRSRGRVALLIAGAPALLVPFLEFSDGVSPLQAVRFTGPWSGWMIALLGASFFSAPLLLGWHTLLLLRPAPPPRLRRACLGVAILAGVPMATLLGFAAHDALTWLADGHYEAGPEIRYWAVSGAIFVAGVLLAWRRRRRAPLLVISLLLAAPYLANAALCLAAFYSTHPTAGYVLSAWVAVVVTADLALRLRRPG